MASKTGGEAGVLKPLRPKVWQVGTGTRLMAVVGREFLMRPDITLSSVFFDGPSCVRHYWGLLSPALGKESAN